LGAGGACRLAAKVLVGAGGAGERGAHFAVRAAVAWGTRSEAGGEGGAEVARDAGGLIRGVDGAL
jgi:hypothetical protein